MTGRLTARIRDLGEHGVALPMALFGLLALSVLVTSALLTASTELALSRAQQEATRALYEADGALERFVADRASRDAEEMGLDGQLAAGEHIHSGPDGSAFRLSVAELNEGGLSESNGVIERRDVFAIIATPGDGWGRSVGALVEAARTIEWSAFDIDAATTFGVNTMIEPGATISTRSPGDAPCDSVVAASAIRSSNGVSLVVGSGANVNGAIVTDSVSSTNLFRRALGGRSIDELAGHADIRYGPRFGEPAYSGLASQWAGDAKHRWGCPASLVLNCLAGQGEYMPVVAIDAGGGTVDISGEHGQGVIIVLGGNLHLRGGFAFGGLVVVEGAVTTSGSVVIEGAILAMGDSVSTLSRTSLISGANSVIRFSECRIREAERSLALRALDAAPRGIASPTFGWFEVVR